MTGENTFSSILVYKDLFFYLVSIMQELVQEEIEKLKELYESSSKGTIRIIIKCINNS